MAVCVCVWPKRPPGICLELNLASPLSLPVSGIFCACHGFLFVYCLTVSICCGHVCTYSFFFLLDETDRRKKEVGRGAARSDFVVVRCFWLLDSLLGTGVPLLTPFLWGSRMGACVIEGSKRDVLMACLVKDWFDEWIYGLCTKWM